MTRHYRPFVTVAIALTLLLSEVSSAQPSTLPGSNGAQVGHPSNTVIVAVPKGLVVVLDTSDLADPSWKKAVDNPSISGVALQIHWADIEATKGKPDWSQLDALFAAATASKKWVHLLIFPGFFSPQWALKDAVTANFPIQYGPGKGGDAEPLPMPWDSEYLNNWLAFVKRVADRYGTTTALSLVAAAGPTSVSAEFTLPATPPDLKKWETQGYTPTKYIGAWKTVLKAYADDFPNQYISVSQGTGLNINDQSKPDPGESHKTRQAIVDAASSILGKRFVLQSSNVHAGPGPHTPNSAVDDQFVIGYIGRAITGFQLRTSAQNHSDIMGAAGDPSLALTKSIAYATVTNSAGQRVNYVEIYAADVLAPDMQSALSSAASIFTGPGPLVPRVTH
jgi:hypothetical protein